MGGGEYLFFRLISFFWCLIEKRGKYWPETRYFSDVLGVKRNSRQIFQLLEELRVVRCYFFQLFRALKVRGHYIFQILEA